MARKKAFKALIDDDSDLLTSPGIEIHHDAVPPKLERAKDKAERRTADRFDVNFEVVVFCKGLSFRTTTLNVSTAGTLLNEPIPAGFVGQILDLVLVRKNKNGQDYFLVKGIALEAPMRSPRIEFVNLQDEQKKKLEQLFAELKLKPTKK